MARPAARHDRDAGGPADVLAAKAALRQEVWAAMREARAARFPRALAPELSRRYSLTPSYTLRSWHGRLS